MTYSNRSDNASSSLGAVKAPQSGLMVELARVVAIPAKNASFTEQLQASDSHPNDSYASSIQATDIQKPSNNVLWVETLVSSSCSSCNAKATCGHSILGRWFERKRQCIPVMCRNGEAGLLSVGQWVEVGVPENILLRASLLAYLLPLFGLLLGAVVCAHFSLFGQSGGDASAIAGAIFGLMSGVLFSRYASQRLFTSDRLPRLIRSVAAPQN